MAISEAFSGSLVISTIEQSLTTATDGPDVETSDGWFQPFLDLGDVLAFADDFEFNVYEKVLSTSTQRKVYRTQLTPLPSSMPIWPGPVLGLIHGWDMTLDKLAGTNRTLEWSIRKSGAISEAFSGSETITTTEHSMITDTAGPDVDTSDGWFQCFLDLSALAAGDVFEARIYEKVRSVGTQRLLGAFPFSGVQSTPNVAFPVLGLMNGWDMTLVKIAGTNRNIDWSIRKAA
jgi:hypothetical protein